MDKEKIEEAKEIFKGWLEFNKKNKNILEKADVIIEVQETLLQYIDELEHIRLLDASLIENSILKETVYRKYISKKVIKGILDNCTYYDEAIQKINELL